MIGYIEPDYDVKATFVGKALVYELRQALAKCPFPRGVSIMPYIAVAGKNVDLLLKYGNEDDVAKDWNNIIEQDDIKLDELNFSERIVNHSRGYGRDGSVTMY